MVLSQFERLRGPVIHLSLMIFWRPLVYFSDTRGIYGLLHSRLRWFDKSALLVRSDVSDSGLAKVQDPKLRAQVRLLSSIAPAAVADTMRDAISWADTTYGAFWHPRVDGFYRDRWPGADRTFDAKALPRWVIRTGTKGRVSVWIHSRPASCRTLSP